MTQLPVLTPRTLITDKSGLPTMQFMNFWQQITGLVAQLARQISAGYAPINSPNFTGTPTAPTATAGTNNTQIATTAFSDTAAANAAASKLPLVGVTNGSNAPAGQIGEYIVSSIIASGAVALTTAIFKNVTSISLTAGDWDIFGNVVFVPAGTTTASQYIGAVGTASATLPTITQGCYSQIFGVAFAAGQSQSMSAGTQRLNLTVTTTVYLVAYSVFATSTSAAYGFIGARRMR